jgi:flagellar biosynthesis/type III secretory pathway protein FliH
MIVRGSILSEKRVPLESALSHERAHLAAVRATPGVARDPEPTAVPATPPPIIALAPPPPAPLSLEAVSKWLAGQDESTRAALARQLAGNIDELQRAAQDQGFAAGRKAGRAEAETATQSHLETLAAIHRSAELAFASEVALLTTQCAEIVGVAIARIAGPLLATPEAALGAVIEVLKRLTEEREVVIRVSTADVGAVEAAAGPLAVALAGRRYSIVADARVQVGGAIVESNLGSLDGRLEIQLRGLAETVLAAKTAHREQP